MFGEELEKNGSVWVLRGLSRFINGEVAWGLCGHWSPAVSPDIANNHQNLALTTQVSRRCSRILGPMMQSFSDNSRKSSVKVTLGPGSDRLEFLYALVIGRLVSARMVRAQAVCWSPHEVEMMEAHGHFPSWKIPCSINTHLSGAAHRMWFVNKGTSSTFRSQVARTMTG